MIYKNLGNSTIDVRKLAELKVKALKGVEENKVDEEEKIYRLDEKFSKNILEDVKLAKSFNVSELVFNIETFHSMGAKDVEVLLDDFNVFFRISSPKELFEKTFLRFFAKMLFKEKNIGLIFKITDEVFSFSRINTLVRIALNRFVGLPKFVRVEPDFSESSNISKLSIENFLISVRNESKRLDTGFFTKYLEDYKNCKLPVYVRFDNGNFSIIEKDLTCKRKEACRINKEVKQRCCEATCEFDFALSYYLIQNNEDAKGENK